jgi:hypothetical protein
VKYAINANDAISLFLVFHRTDKRYEVCVFGKVVEPVEYYNISEDTILLSLISNAKNDKKKNHVFAVFCVNDKR